MKTTDYGSIHMVMGIKEWGLILILSIIWGGSFFFNEVALKELTPFTIVMSRLVIGALVLLGVVYASRKRMPTSPRLWGAFLVMGALNNLIPFSLITWGQQQIESSLASILNATTPIFSVLLAHFLTREERLTPNRVIGIIIGWIGVAVLLGIESLKGVGANVMGEIAVLCAALSYANAAVFGRRFSGIPPLVVAAGMLSASALVTLPVALILEAPWRLSPGLITWGAVAGLSMLCTAVAYLIYFRVLATAGATNILLVTFIIPVSAITLGVFVLGESPGWHSFSGMALIFIGLIAIDGRLPARLRGNRK